MMKFLAVGSVLVCSATGFAQVDSAAQKKQDKLVHINQIQVIGSHNSYHAGFAPSEHKYLEKAAPKALYGLDYSHPSLGEQLSGGVRQLEIDVYIDDKGGRYAHPKIVDKVAAAGLPADPDFDPDHEMDKPGLKVMHVQDLDERSRCHTFVKCLTDIRAWSKAHPGHLPLFILVESKQGGIESMPDAPVAEDFTPKAYDNLDAEIRSVFKPTEMITPDEVRGSYPTLNAAIKAGKWPTLDKARDRVVFLLDGKTQGPVYSQGHPSLRGRLLFINGVPGEAEAAFVEQNSGTKAEIDTLVRDGYLIRTRTDEGTAQARTNDTTRRDLALSSGAQIISTDYPAFEPSAWTGFSVGLPGGLVARCNPINKPAGCVDALLQDSAAH